MKPSFIKHHYGVIMPKIFVRSAHNYDRNKASKASALRCNDPTLAQQQFKEECDINTIVARFHLTGEVPQLTTLPTYDNYEGIFDFQTAMNAVRAGQEQFMTLPAQLRARFNNDPQQFHDFCLDGENLPEIQKLGLLSDDAVKRLRKAESDAKAKEASDIIANHEASKTALDRPGADKKIK